MRVRCIIDIENVHQCMLVCLWALKYHENVFACVHMCVYITLAHWLVVRGTESESSTLISLILPLRTRGK